MSARDGSPDLTRTGTERPPHRSGLIQRHRILQQLTAISHGAAVVTLLAPAGYGKTTVLSQWAARAPDSFAWVTVDQADNDPVHLVRHIVRALQRLEPVQDEALTSLASRNASLREVLVPALLTWLDEHAGDRVLVLDDVDRLRNPDSLGVIDTLAHQLPPGWHLALASRTRPQLPVAPLRRQRRYLELGAQDLSFTVDEARTVLAGAGVLVSDDGLQSLIRRVEAWPAGIYLVALSLRAGSSPASASEVTGGAGRLGAYFRDNVLRREDADSVDFLLRSAVLERMSGPLCDAVLQTTGSAARLTAMKNANLFVVPQDQRGQWYRYHELFAELLRAELRARDPGAERDLHRRAATWFSEHGMFQDAIEHALAGQDVATAARLTSMCTQRLSNDGRIATVRRWIEAMDAAGPAAYPPLAVSASWVWALEGEAAKAQHSLLTAENASFEGRPSDGSFSLESGIRIIRGAMARLGVAQMLVDGRRAVELEPPGSPWHPVATWVLGSAELLHGDRQRAAKAFERTAFLGRAQQKPAACLALAQLSLLAAEDGDWAGAAARADQARDLIRAGRLEDHLASMPFYVASATLATHEGNRESALLNLGHAVRLHSVRPTAVAFPWVAAQVAIAVGRLLLELGDVSEARMKAGQARLHVAQLATQGALREQLQHLAKEVTRHRRTAGLASAMALTQGELRVLRLLPTHLNLAEIGVQLDLSRSTVKNHVAAIYRKLQTTSRAETVRRGRELGLLTS
jgi:LuxR family maltose regulon positive regulatory protein